MRLKFKAVLILGLAALTTLHAGNSAVAQDGAQPLVVGWTEMAPFFESGEDGDVDGFSAEVIERVAEIAGIEILFQQFSNLSEMRAAQAEGTTDILAGVAPSPMLEPGSLYSEPVAVTHVRLFMRTEEADISQEDFIGMRLGVVPPAAGSNPSPLLDRNTAVRMPNTATLLMRLLDGDIDGALVTEVSFFRQAHAAQLDHRIAAVGPPVGAFDRVVVLRREHAELLGAINEAVAVIEDNGDLEALRQKWGVVLPPPAPEVLVVGVTDFPPLQVVTEDGEFTGYAVEAVRELARRAGQPLKFIEISPEEWAAGPRPGAYDMLPQSPVTDARRERMDFSLPIEIFTTSIFMPANNSDGIASLADLREAGLRVAVSSNSASRGFVESEAGLSVDLVPNSRAALDAVLSGDADAMVAASSATHRMIEERGAVGKIVEVLPPVYVAPRAPALRPGLGTVREQFNSLTPGFLASEQHRFLVTRWYGEPIFWTQERVRLAVGGILAVAVGAIVAFLMWRQRVRQRHFAEIQAANAQLERQNARLDELNAELLRSNGELDNFAYVASHDLKEPLRGVTINANFLLREDLGERARDRVERMTELCQRMERLISDLLFFSRLSQKDTQPEAVDVTSVVGEIRRSLAETISEKNGVLEIDGDLPKVLAQPTRIATVFQNLIVNALKYNDSGAPAVEVGFAREVTVGGVPKTNMFFVRDNGIGIEEEFHDEVFRIFRRLNSDKIYGYGTGAGLSFVKRIIEDYGGEVTFVSTPGQGTTFYFSLPLADEETTVSGVTAMAS